MRPTLLVLILPCLALAEPGLEWVNTYDAGGNYVDAGTELLVDAAGNVIVGGASHDGVGGTDIHVIKYRRDDASVMWQARMEAYDHASDMAIDGMAWDGAGNVLVAGRLLGCGTG